MVEVELEGSGPAAAISGTWHDRWKDAKQSRVFGLTQPLFKGPAGERTEPENAAVLIFANVISD